MDYGVPLNKRYAGVSKVLADLAKNLDKVIRPLDDVFLEHNLISADFRTPTIVRIFISHASSNFPFSVTQCNLGADE